MRVGLLLLVVLALSGCAWSPKPYADDPIVRTRLALPGDPQATSADAPPEPPRPPDAPALADRGER